MPTCQCINARALEPCGGPCHAPIQQDRDYVSLVEAYRGISSLMLDFQILFFQQVHAGSSYANPTHDLTSAATRGVNHAWPQLAA